MARPQDIQDLRDHRQATEGEHNIAPKSKAGGVPLADAKGKIDNSWLNDTVVTTDPGGGGTGQIPVAVLPDTVVQLVNGKIPMGQLPNHIKGKIYQSSRDGSAVQGTGFLLSNGQDLMTYFASQMGSVKSVRNAISVSGRAGTQCLIRSMSASLENNNTQLVLTAALVPWNCFDCNCGP